MPTCLALPWSLCTSSGAEAAPQTRRVASRKGQSGTFLFGARQQVACPKTKRATCIYARLWLERKRDLRLREASVRVAWGGWLVYHDDGEVYICWLQHGMEYGLDEPSLALLWCVSFGGCQVRQITLGNSASSPYRYEHGVGGDTGSAMHTSIFVTVCEVARRIFVQHISMQSSCETLHVSDYAGIIAVNYSEARGRVNTIKLRQFMS